MARTMSRPIIEVEAVYMGERPMMDVFVWLLVAEVQKAKNPNRTFEGVKQPQYNTGIEQD